MKRRRKFSQKRVFELKSSYICREYRKEFSLKLINLLRRLKIFFIETNSGNFFHLPLSLITLRHRVVGKFVALKKPSHLWANAEVRARHGNTKSRNIKAMHD